MAAHRGLSREGHIYLPYYAILLADSQNISSTMSRADYKEPIPLVLFIIDDAYEKFYALPNCEFSSPYIRGFVLGEWK